MLKLIAVFLGGGIGVSLRWLVCEFFCKHIKLEPHYATFLINIIGSFALGFLFWHFINKVHLPQEYKIFFTVGICGGFTTFSTFALENFNLIQEGELFKSAIYIILSTLLSIGGVILGVYIAKQI